jgi:hypothetical protein
MIALPSLGAMSNLEICLSFLPRERDPTTGIIMNMGTGTDDGGQSQSELLFI